jgi:hypothetical protein
LSWEETIKTLSEQSLPIVKFFSLYTFYWQSDTTVF